MQQKSELPEGWILVSLGELIEPSKEKIEPLENPNLKYVGLEHIEPYKCQIKEHGFSANIKSTKTVFNKGDILYGKLRPYLNKVCIPNFDGVCSTDILVFKAISNLNNYYLMRFLSTPEVVDYANNNSSGVQLPRINFQKLSSYTIPLPPLLEQHRIVSAIEALFARLDAINEKLDRVLKILKNFRQSVLKAACDGRLTEEWRKDNQIKENSWLDLDFFDFCVLQRGYDLPISKRGDGPYPIMASSGILEYHNEYKAFGPGVVVGRSGSTGKVHYVEENYWPHNTTLFVKDFKKNYPRFVYLFLINFNLDQFSASTAVPTLNRNNLRGIIVSVPSLSEQYEIVQRVNALFAFADSIESKVITAREKTEKLRLSILEKAFSGELVPTEAEIAKRECRDYETAEVLLERIKREKAKTKGKTTLSTFLD